MNIAGTKARTHEGTKWCCKDEAMSAFTLRLMPDPHSVPSCLRASVPTGGFTLAELLIVIALIVLLVAMAVPALTSSPARAA